MRNGIWCVATAFAIACGVLLMACSDSGGGGSAYRDEGTYDDPIDITGSLPYSGQLAENGVSYYRVTDLDAGTTYTIAVSDATDQVDLQVWDSTDTQICSADLGTDISCDAPVTSLIKIGVEGAFAEDGAAFEVNVE